MENDKDKKNVAKPQVFYFSEEGRLIVESNKGIWVDGTPYVKMYGSFQCNAKTMGEIIHQLKGIAVEVGELKYVNDEDVERHLFGNISFSDKHIVSCTRCVLGASQERIEEYEHELAKQEFVHERIEELQKQCEEYEAKIYGLNKSIEKFNRLPWWKRMFKKIEVK